MNYYNNAPVTQILEESVGIVVVISAALLAGTDTFTAGKAFVLIYGDDLAPVIKRPDDICQR